MILLLVVIYRAKAARARANAPTNGAVMVLAAPAYVAGLETAPLVFAALLGLVGDPAESP